MPLYEFTCTNCGSNFEKRVSFSAVTTPACDSCQSPNVQRRVSAPAIHFKGSGWYITDSKKSTSVGSGEKSSRESSKSTATATAA
ncbi:MAG: zinc ribbon domain-containing protein [Caldilineaceae bacterium]